MENQRTKKFSHFLPVFSATCELFIFMLALFAVFDGFNEYCGFLWTFICISMFVENENKETCWKVCSFFCCAFDRDSFCVKSGVLLLSLDICTEFKPCLDICTVFFDTARQLGQRLSKKTRQFKIFHFNKLQNSKSSKNSKSKETMLLTAPD